MIKRWLRRRLGVGEPDEEANLDEEDREHGVLVRKGQLVALRTHVGANREAFQRWYGDPEIAELLRHDLEPLTEWQSRGYFDTFILPSSARGLCYAIHERKGKRLIGTTALTDRTNSREGASALFRIAIGEKDAWGRGFGTEATQLVMEEAFEALGLAVVRLEVFGHNARALATYRKVGFEVVGEHTEWVPRRKIELRVIEMRLTREQFARTSGSRGKGTVGAASGGGGHKRLENREAREARKARRTTRQRAKSERSGGQANDVQRQSGMTATD